MDAGIAETGMGDGRAVPGRHAVDARAYRNAMAELASSVHVVTTTTAHGRFGLTATAVCSVSDKPPTLMISVNRGRSAGAAFASAERISVNTLAVGQEAIADRFAGLVSMSERFVAGHWFEGATGAPALRHALVRFDCLTERVVEIATHHVLFCVVVGVDVDRAAGPLVYHRRAYTGGL